MSDRQTWTLNIEGMTCHHCAVTIDAALRRVPGVVGSATGFADGRAQVIAEAAVEGATLVEAIAASGYTVVGRQAHAMHSEPEASTGGDVDLAIVGGGSASFAAAITAAEFDARVLIIERGTLGGTCVNVGCVPSKTLIRAAEVAHRVEHHAFAGIRARLDGLDYAATLRQKDQLVAELRQVKYRDVLAAYPSIELVEGHATFDADGRLTVNGRRIAARKVVVATGAHPWAPPIPGLDQAPYLTSTEALALDQPPRTLAVIGGSAVGLELAQLFARMGTRITVLEALPRLVAAEDADVGEALAGYLRNEGLTVHTGATLTQVSGGPGRYRVDVEHPGGKHSIETEQLLVATGRRANTVGLGLDAAGIRLGRKGEIFVNDYLETTRTGVYAAGDVIGDPMLVYVAAYAGSIAAENALRGNTRRYDLSVVPRVTFTDPTVASVGLTETQAREGGRRVAVSKLPLSYVPRALAARDTRGFIKLIADEETNLFLGAYILAPEAGEMIQAVAMAMRFGIRVDDVASMLHPYLTHAEGIKLAAQTFKKDVAKLSCCAA